MKLVRLSTNDNGYFKSSFGTEMVLKPYSKMALLNLTFQSSIGKLIILPEQVIITQTDEANALTLKSVSLDGLTFPSTPAGFVNFNKYLTAFMNKTLNIGYAQGAASEINCSGSMYQIIPLNGKFSIVYRYCPFINPFHYIPGIENRGEIEIMDYDESIDISFFSVVGLPAGTFTHIEKGFGVDESNNNSDNILTSQEISTGSGFLSARIHDYVDNLSGGEDNGFAIGLSDFDLSSIGIEPGDPIPSDNVYCELRFNRKVENYKFRTPGSRGFDQNSDVTPLKTTLSEDENVNTHDVLGFEIQHGKVSIIVYQDAAGTANRQVISTFNMDPGTKLYPYMYVRGERIVTKYVDLPTGNRWTQVNVPNSTFLFDEINIGSATYRRVAEFTPAVPVDWWEAQPGSAQGWNIYNSGPPVVGQAVDDTANISGVSGLITVVGTGEALNPQFAPKNIPVPGGVKIDMFNWTANSLQALVPQGGQYTDPGSWGPFDVEEDADEDDSFYFSTDKSAMDNSYDALQYNAGGANIQRGLPSVLYNGNIDTRWKTDKETKLTIPNELIKPLGFTKNIPLSVSTRSVNEALAWTAGWDADVEPTTYTADNFIVESMSLPLDSFDASKVQYNSNKNFPDTTERSGRRKNILMTVPVNDNLDGLVEFQTNTPIFIDINNDRPLNAKNLNFRILKEDFSPILQTEENAIMTILIDSG